MARGIKKAIDKAQQRIQKEIRGNSSRGGKYASGLSAEGYAGGYYQALSDVQLALNDVKPSTRGYWDDTDLGGRQ
ncbi:MAG: hypothetical protein SV201_05875 [Pseudomonadota bacterium]|nr:hypothetical protein [Pseudomonadota bacterium]